MPVPIVAAVGGAAVRGVASGGARSTIRGTARNARRKYIEATEQAFLFEQGEAEIRKHHTSLLLYAPAFMVAGFKDMMDLVGIGSLPGIGTIVTLCCSILIFLLLFITRTNKSLIQSRFLIRAGLILIFATLVEGLALGLNFLPIEIMTIYAIYWLDKHEGSKAAQAIQGTLSLVARSGKFGRE